MRAKIEFQLPDEQVEFECAANGNKVVAVLWDIDQYLRAQQKHEGQESVKIERLRGIIRETLEDHGLHFDMIMFS
jgi:hypothetical protein